MNRQLLLLTTNKKQALKPAITYYQIKTEVRFKNKLMLWSTIHFINIQRKASSTEADEKNEKVLSSH